MQQNDHPNATAFLNHVSRFIVGIWARFADDPGPPRMIGTGFIFGYATGEGGVRPIVVTAAHVIDHDARDRTEWTIVRLGTSEKPQRAATFTTPAEKPSGPWVTWYTGKWYQGVHDKAFRPSLDIGFLMFPNDACPGGFIEADEDIVAPLPKDIVLTAGTRVAWAGFPEAAHKLLGKPFVCYFEGVVSTMVDDPELPPLYLIDGHNTRGLSGAPVWSWHEADGRVRIAGVITHYSSIDAAMPGFVHATPLNVLMAFLNKSFEGRIKPPPQEQK